METQVLLKFKNYTQKKFSLNHIETYLASELKNLGKRGIFEVSLTVCGNARIRSLNNKYREIDQPTDVLSFGQVDVGQEIGPKILGDIVVSAEKITSQAREFGIPFEQEFDKMLLHSLKHLLGIHHKE